MLDTSTIIAAVIAAGFVGLISAVVVLVWLSQKEANQAAADARADRIGALAAAEASRQAQEVSLAASRALLEVSAAMIETVKHSDQRVERFQATLDSVHVIVNSERTVARRLVAELRRRVANENPDDPIASAAAESAEAEADTLERRGDL